MFMKEEITRYEINPKILRVGAETEIKIKSFSKRFNFTAEKYVVQILPLFQSREPAYDYPVIDAEKISDDTLRFKHTFGAEQEHYIRVFSEEQIDNNAKFLNEKYHKKNAHITLSVYALEDDLYELNPYKGDLHAHSNESDGKDNPEIAMANYRKNGFDFVSLTDHRKYYPSVQVCEYFKDKPIDLHIVKGEEVHAPNNHVHIINFGANKSINEMFQNNPEQYEEEVNEILATLNIPEGMSEVNAYEYASCTWVFRKIKEAGGLAIYVHPHWMADVYHVPDILSDVLFRDMEFDAFEFLGGHEQRPNNIQAAYYNQKLRDGSRVCPIVGSSDAHSTEPGASWFTWTFSIVFAKNLDTGSIIDAVKDYKTVAVENYTGEAVRVHGDYRLVNYAYFLLEEYFPLHEELCFEEGIQMKNIVRGKGKAVDILELLKGRTSELLQYVKGQK